MAAGAGLCDPKSSRLVAREAADRIDDLIGFGAPFDRDPTARWRWAAKRPIPRAASCMSRATAPGAAISPTLAARARHAIDPCSKAFMPWSWRPEDGRVTGISRRARLGGRCEPVAVRARAVVLATGGLGALYAVTTNPLEARGEGLGDGGARRRPDRRSRIRAVSSHRHRHRPRSRAAGDRSAARRRRGAGQRAGRALHAGAAPGRRTGAARHRGARHLIARSPPAAALPRRDAAIGAHFAEHFPTVYAACLAAGIDPARQPIPVAPAAHYHMGGIARGRAWPLVAARPVGGRRMCPPPACTAPTAWPPTRCWKRWSSARALPRTSPRPCPRLPALPGMSTASKKRPPPRGEATSRDDDPPCRRAARRRPARGSPARVCALEQRYWKARHCATAPTRCSSPPACPAREPRRPFPHRLSVRRSRAGASFRRSLDELAPRLRRSPPLSACRQMAARGTRSHDPAELLHPEPSCHRLSSTKPCSAPSRKTLDAPATSPRRRRSRPRPRPPILIARQPGVIAGLPLAWRNVPKTAAASQLQALARDGGAVAGGARADDLAVRRARRAVRRARRPEFPRPAVRRRDPDRATCVPPAPRRASAARARPRRACARSRNMPCAAAAGSIIASASMTPS